MKKFICLVLMIGMLAASFVGAFGAQQGSFSMPVKITDAEIDGTVTIEAQSGGGQTDTVQVINGEGSYSFSQELAGTYDYKVTQVPGNKANVTYDKTEYLVRVTYYYVEDEATGKQELVSEGFAVKTADFDGNPITIDPENLDKCDIVFKNIEKEYMTVKRTVTFTRYTPTGETMFVSVVQPVELERIVTTTVGPDGQKETSRGPWAVKDTPENWKNLDAVAAPEEEGWEPNVPSRPSWRPDNLSNPNRLNLDDPKDIVENIYYNPKTTDEVEYKTVKRTITYTQFTPEGELISETVEQVVTIKRTKTSATDGTVTYGPWEVEQGDLGSIDSPNIGGWTPSRSSLPPWGPNDTSNPNRLNLEDPQDITENVFYTTYVVVNPTVQKKVTGNPPEAGRFVLVMETEDPANPMPDGSIGGARKLTIIGPGTYDFGQIVFTTPGTYTYKMYEEAGNLEGYTYDASVYEVTFTVYVENLQMKADRTDKVNGKEAEGAIFHNPYGEDPELPIDPDDVVEEETKVITRTITYTEYTPDGKEVSKSVTQTVTLKRKVVKNPNGYVKSVGKWEIDPEKSDTSEKVSPEKEGWNPNKSVIGEWQVDLDDPKSEIIHVVYTPEGEPVVEELESEEFKTITRTITYTEYTPDGKQVFTSVVQTVTLRRSRLENIYTGEITYTGWSIYEGEAGAVSSKEKEGWIFDKALVEAWQIDLSDPRDEVVHVIYTPAGGPGPKTGDAARPVLWALALLMSAAAGAVLLAKRRRRA